MRKSIVTALVSAFALLAPAAHAEELDWNRPKDRELIDGAMRHFASQCAKIGFTEVDRPDPATMQNRLYSRSLLIPSYQSRADLERWSGWVGAMTSLGKQDEGLMAEAADQGGAALTAAVVDPTSHEAAKKKYLEASMAPLRNFMLACDSAARHEFASKYYVSGSGSLATIEASFGELFDKTVADLKAEMTVATK